MKKNKKLLIVIGAVVLIGIVSLLAYRAQNKSASDNVVRIGAILPLSGAASFYGESGRRGIELAIELFKQKHPDVEIKAEILDDKGGMREGLSAANQLKSLGCSYVVGPMMSGVALAVAAAHKNESDFVLVLPTATTPTLRGFADNVFRTCVSDDSEGGAVADYVYRAFDAKVNVAVLHLNNEYGLGVATAFVSRLKRFEVQPSIIEAYDAQDSDVRVKLLKVLSKKPTGIFLVGQKEQRIVVKQLRELGFNGKIFGTTMFEDPELLSMKEMVGAVYSSRVLRNGKDGSSAHPFYALYENRYRDGANYYAASCFDSATCALNFALESIQRQDVSRVKIPGMILIDDGATGSLQFDDKHDVMQSFAMKMVSGDGSQIVIQE